MGADAVWVEGGFADPVFDAQAVFRSVMSAFAEPGTVADFGPRVVAPPPLVPAAGALLAALADGDTPVWLGDTRAGREAAARWLAFQTGAPITQDPGAAFFAVLPLADDPAGWERFAAGTPEFPDRSATLLLPVSSFVGGATLLLEGPGIATSRAIAPTGLPASFISAMAANRSRFPLGFDLVLVCRTAALALPRTTRIRES